jgi:hypothetical protein
LAYEQRCFDASQFLDSFDNGHDKTLELSEAQQEIVQSIADPIASEEELNSDDIQLVSVAQQDKSLPNSQQNETQNKASSQTIPMAQVIQNKTTKSDVNERNVYFQDILREFQGLTFSEIETKAKDIHIAYDIACDQTINICESRLMVDKVAHAFKPNDMPDDNIRRLPVNIIGDGNCLPRSGSFLVAGNEDLHVEIRARIVVELAKHTEVYLDPQYLGQGLNLSQKECVTLPSRYAQFSPHYSNQNQHLRPSGKYMRLKSLMLPNITHTWAYGKCLECPVF